MVTLTVYGDPKSTCTQRILILLEELKLKYTLETVDLKKEAHKDSTFLALQPFGKVPVIVYGDKVIFESRSILRYISKNNIEDVDLTLDNSYEVDMWLEAESQNFNPLISKIVYEKLFKAWKKQDTDEHLVRETLEGFKKVLDVYESRLSASKYIGGDHFSIADISHIPYLNYFLKSDSSYKALLKEYPRVYKWFKRLMMRDAVKDVLSM